MVLALIAHLTRGVFDVGCAVTEGSLGAYDDRPDEDGKKETEHRRR